MSCTKENPQISYDSKYDVLYYNIGDTSNSIATGDNGDIEIFRDFDTNEITGYIVFDFKNVCETKKSKEYAMLSRIFDIPSVMKICKLEKT